MKLIELISELDEATALYSNPYEPEEDIGLMTLKDFLWYRNTQDKSHPDEVYDTTLASMNRRDSARRVDISGMDVFKGRKAVVQVYSGFTIETPTTAIITVDGKPVAVYKDEVLYYTVYFPIKIIPINWPVYQEQRLIIKPKSTRRVKYLDEYIDEIVNVSGRNTTNYPAVMQRIKIDGDDFTVRTKTLPYVKNSGETIVILNDENYIVATASDEWGATLLRVVSEYRGKDIGKILGGIWYKNNPSFPSGGFSASGKSNAIKIWADRVRYLLQSGMYSFLVKHKEITQEKVNEIVGGLPERKVRTPKEKVVTQPEPLLYSDMDSMFVLYDKKFYENQDERYVYAHGFLRKANGKMYIYTLDYDKPYRKIAIYTIFQIAYNNKIKLYMESPPSDHVELGDIEGITVDDDNFAALTQPAMNLAAFASREKQYRKQHDQYDEVYHRLLEIANSKWD